MTELKGGVSSLNSGDLLHELHNNVLPYWMNRMVDHEHGGFYGRRNGYDELEKDAAKGVILNTRILWTFSCAARVFNDERYLEIAHRAYSYINDHFIDRHFGGVYWMVDCHGEPLHTKKQVYAQAFAIYALAEYVGATGNQEGLKEAQNLFRLIERHSFDQKENGYLEAFDRQWNLLDDLRLSEKDANSKKTMNTHLHILEAYTNLYRYWKDEALAKQLRNLIVLFIERILNKSLHFDLFFSEQWEVQSEEISFGHDIEGSWLLCEAAEVLGDEALLARVRDVCIKMTDVSIREGLDADGGLMNEADKHGLTDTDKHWWPQAEAMVGYVNAWQLTGDKKYLLKAEKTWAFIQHNLIDKEHGEWHWMVNLAGKVDFKEDKAGPWKCPYHNGRALIEVARRLSDSPKG